MGRFRKIQGRRIAPVLLTLVLAFGQAVTATGPLMELGSASATGTHTSNKGKVEVIKDIVPNTDPGKFNLSIDGPDWFDTTAKYNVGDNGTTGEVTLDTGWVEVSEWAGWDTTLSDYTTSVVCRDGNGNGTVVAQGTPNDSDDRKLSFNLAKNADVVCKFTNTRKTGTIKLIKNVINDDGGTATANDFGLSIGNTNVTSGQVLTLPTGKYAIDEDGLPGYSFVNITGTGCPKDLGGKVTLGHNQNIVCTITNNDEASGRIRLIKEVTNDNGGNAVASDFQLTLNGNVKAQNQYHNVVPGTYTVGENAVAGYTMTSIKCYNDHYPFQELAHPVAVGHNKFVTCKVKNNDNAPSLKVVKDVTNNNGGTVSAGQFQLKVNGSNVSQNTALAGIKSNTTYTVTENQQPGYTATGVKCVDSQTGAVVSNSQNGSGSVSLNEGQNVVCTVYNDDIPPKLTVVKTVTNNNGGTLQVSDFPLYVNGNLVVSGQQNTVDQAGAVTVSEDNKPGYTAGTWGGDCDLNGNLTLQVGGVYTCTINNDDQPATIIVDKVVVNDNGGTAEEDDWSLYVNQTLVLGEMANTFDGYATYSVSESEGPYGYQQTSIECKDVTSQTPVAVAHPFTAEPGHTYHCTITNDDKEPSVKIHKYTQSMNVEGVEDFDFTLSNGGTDQEFTIDNGSNNTHEVTTGLKAGEVTITETIPDGWSQYPYVYCYGAEAQTTGASTTFSLGLGDHVECDYANVQLSKVEVIKFNDLDRDGKYDETESELGLVDPTLSDWSIKLNDTVQQTDENGKTVFEGLEPEEVYILDEIQQPGWHLSNIYCDNIPRGDEQEGPALLSSLLDGISNLTETDGYEVYPYAGETVKCYVGNYYDAALNLTKSNNKPAPTVAGDTVTYTLTVSLPSDSGTVFDAKVIDLPPNGFTYVPGSYTANSSVRGDLSEETTPEPTYASPGQWLLGAMVPGEVVTLTYKAVIGAKTTAGTYPDVAYAYGQRCNMLIMVDCEEAVYSNMRSASNPFVSTAVAIKAGAETPLLVNTGTELMKIYAVLAALLMTAGISVARRSAFTKGGAR